MTELSTKKRDKLPDDEFACPIDRKLPINDAAHVRNAMARFDQVITSSCHPEAARQRIINAARKYGVDVKDFEKVRKFQGKT